MTINLPLEKLGPLASGLRNKHVSLPVLAGVLLGAVQIWWPQWYAIHEAQIRETQKLLFAYGIIASSTLGAAPPPPAASAPPSAKP